MREITQYRVTWQRIGMPRKRKSYWSLKPAMKLIALMGDKPWEALGVNPDEPFCCRGRRDDECGCGGQTWRAKLLGDRGEMPPVMWWRVESRVVVQGEWAAVDSKGKEPR